MSKVIDSQLVVQSEQMRKMMFTEHVLAAAGTL